MFRPFKRLRVQVSCGTQLITKQEFKEESDINNIITQYKQTGIINHITKSQPIYSDLPPEMDYQQSLNMYKQAQDAFATLPSVVRRYFDNNPSRLLAALQDPSMRPALEELNILVGPGNPQPPGNPVNRNPSAAGTLATEPQLPLRSPSQVSPQAPADLPP